MIDAPATSLPLSPTALIGRDADLARLLTVITGGEARLITLTGPGGIGKTRLALELARALEAEYAHGVHLVTLSAVTDASLVPRLVAETMRSPATTTASVMAALRDHHGLIVIDNAEHLVEVVAPWVADVLAQCPRLHILVTSRVPLHVRGERLEAVEPLAVPADDVALERIASVALFAARARDVDPEFTVTVANAASVAGICRRLDGIPLAIELAASHVDVLDPATLLRRLGTQSDVLRDGPRDVPERHRTMTSAIRWSLDLLSASERRLFGLLCVFTGTFSLGAAERLAGAADGLAILTTLRHHSLIHSVASLAGDPRFAMLEPIRQAGLHLLHAELDSARDEVAGCMLDLARQADHLLRDHGDVEGYDRLEADRATLWNMIAWLTGRQRIDDSLDLAGAIWYLRRQRGDGPNALATLRSLLGHPDAAVPSERRARALALLGVVASERGDADLAAASYRDALQLFRDIESDVGIVWVLKSLSFVFVTNEIDLAMVALDESLARARARGHDWAIGAALDQLAGLHMYRNATDIALRCLQESERIHRLLGDQPGVANSLLFQGMVFLRIGAMERAATRFETCIALCHAHGHAAHLPMALVGLAEVQRLRGDLDAAEPLVDDALAIMRRATWLHGIAFGAAALGCLAIARQQPARAHDLLRESMEVYARIGLRYGLHHGAPVCLDGMAWLALESGDLGGAARFLGMADTLYQRMGIDRPVGPPLFTDAGVIDRLRRALERPAIRTSWQEGFDLDDDGILSDALVYRPALPRIDAHFRSRTLPQAARDLSPRELEVLRQLADGLTNQEIADGLFVSVRTVAGHVASILNKLELGSRTGAVAYAIRNGLA